MVRFSHLADCHLGAFGRNPTLREYNLQAFERSIDISIEREVDFIIIAGDLFHNPHPDMDIVNRSVQSLMKARKKGIRIYSVYGSHDFNIARASLIDVLESADVFKKVVHYLDSEKTLEHVTDETGIQIAGISGRKNRMDASYYDKLNFSEPEDGSVFVFHTPIAEMKPADIHERETVPISSLPDGYDYYAGGHIHRNLKDDKNGSKIVYPGVTFGSSYTDLEKKMHRGFVIVDEWETEDVPVEVCRFRREFVEAEGKKSSELEDELLDISSQDISEEVVLLKVTGSLYEGVPEDIDFHKIRSDFEANGAETVYLNRRNLEGKRTDRVKVKEESGEDLENKILEEYDPPENVTTEFQEDLLHVLKTPQGDGETKKDYEDKIWAEVWSLIENIDDYQKDEGEEGKIDEREEEEEDVEERDVKKAKDSQISLMDFGGEKE